MSLRYGFAAGLMAAAALGASPLAAAAQTPRATVADAQTTKIVAAANAFIATLTPAQKSQVMFAYTDAAQRVLWSNLPTGIVERKGIKRGDLDDAQKRALDALLATVLSPVGMKMVREQMEADEVLKNTPGSANGPGRGPGGPPATPRTPGAPGGPQGNGPPPGAGGPPGGPAGGRPPGGRAPLQFGQDLYFVSFLGTPSATAPWELQFGGHHLAINATVVGGGMTLAPSLTGGQPVKYDKDGKEIYIVEDEVKKAQALIDSLSPAQRAKAVLAPQSIDLILGPGHDGQTLQPEGLQAMEMSAAQKTQLLALIEARLGIMNADDLAAAMAKIRLNLNQTSFAWYGPTDSAGGAYFRVTGPTVVLEFSPQDTRTGGVSNHLHNMYRDPTNDYGSAWASLK